MGGILEVIIVLLGQKSLSFRHPVTSTVKLELAYSSKFTLH